MPRLTERQRRFVKLYPALGDAAKAARQAGYSARSARVIAHELLHSPKYGYVQEAIAEEQERIRRRLEVTAERIQNEQAKIAFSSIEKFLAWDGEELKLKPLDQIDPLDRAAIKSIRQTRHGIEIELHSKQDALDALARMAGLYKDSLSLKGDGLLLRIAGLDDKELAQLDAVDGDAE